MHHYSSGSSIFYSTETGKKPQGHIRQFENINGNKKENYIKYNNKNKKYFETIMRSNHMNPFFENLFNNNRIYENLFNNRINQNLLPFNKIKLIKNKKSGKKNKKRKSKKNKKKKR